MERFWFNQYSSLFNKNNLLNIIPYSHMDLNSKLNAVFRLSIYFSVIMFIFKKDYRYLGIIIIMGILTVIIHRTAPKHLENNLQVEDNKIDSNLNEDAEGCKLPSKINPFMNPTFEDFEKGNLKKACNSYDNPVIRNMEDEYFNSGLYREQTDVFGRANSYREFYTMPVNSIVNDSVKFAEWCYKSPPTCREGNAMQCYADLHNHY